MKKFSLIPLAIAVLFGMCTTLFALPTYDTFNYTAGGALDGKTNPDGLTWAALGTGASVQTSASNISYSTFPASAGGTISNYAIANQKGALLPLEGQPFNSGNSSSVYASFILKVTDASTLSTTDATWRAAWFMGFHNLATSSAAIPGVGKFAARIYLKKGADATHFYFGFNKGTSTLLPDIGTNGTAFAQGDTLFIVTKYTFGATAGKLWINPSVSEFGGASDGTSGTIISSIDTADINQIAGYAVLSRSAAQPKGALIDDLRIGTTWAAVTGKPFDKDPTKPIDRFGVFKNANTSFSAPLVGLGATYQWYRSNGVTTAENVLANGADSGHATLAGVTTTNLTLTTVTLDDDKMSYYCVGTLAGNPLGSSGITTSRVAYLEVVDVSQPSYAVTNITSPWGSNVMFYAQTVKLPDANFGTPPIQWQWYSNSVLIPGATATNLLLTSVSNSFEATYELRATNSVGDTNVSATLTVLDPFIISVTPPMTNYTTTDAYLGVNVAASSGPGSVSYQWKRYGTNLLNQAKGYGVSGFYSGVTTTNLVVHYVTGPDKSELAQYSVEVTEAGGDPAFETNVWLSVLGDPIFITYPVNVHTNYGYDVLFTCQAGGTEPLTYQWKYNGANIAGATTTSLTIPAVTNGNEGSYWMVITNPFAPSGMVSPMAILTVDDPGFVVQPQDSTNQSGDDVNFFCVVSGSTVGPSEVYSNNTTMSTPGYFAQTGGLEFGDEISLAASGPRVLTNFTLEYYGLNFSGDNNETMTFRIYANDGSQYGTNVVGANAGADFYAPDTLLYDSGSFAISQTAVSTLRFDLQVLVPTNFTWTVQFGGITGAESAGLTLYDPPTLGYSAGDYWERSGVGDSWLLREPGVGAPDLNFGAAAWAYSGTVLYQWKLNGTNLVDDGIHIVGAQTSSLWITNITKIDATNGGYSVEVTGFEGAALSRVATLLIADPPLVTVHPANQTGIIFGNKVTFTATVTGTAPFDYQWKKNGVDLADGGSVFGSQAAVLTVNPVSVLDEGSYSIYVSNIAGSDDDIGNPGVLTVIDPLIDVQPLSTTNVAGSEATFGVMATGTELAYHWSAFGTNLLDGGNISGATTETLTVSNVQGSDEGTYQVVVSNSIPSGGHISNSIVVTLSVSPSITSQPLSQTNNAGGLASLTVSAAGPGLGYVWSLNGAPVSNGPGHIGGQFTDTLWITNVAQVDATNGSYTVAVTNGAGFTNSAPVTLTVVDGPQIVFQTGNQTANAGDTNTFTVQVTGTWPQYQWFKAVDPLSDGGNVSGATSDTLTLSGVFSADDTNYWVRITNSAGVAVSTNAVLTVIDPHIATQPIDGVGEINSDVTFTVFAHGTLPLSYQWLSNGLPVTDATNSALVISNVQVFDNGEVYSVIVSNALGEFIASSNATLHFFDPGAVVYDNTTNRSSTTHFAQSGGIEFGDEITLAGSSSRLLTNFAFEYYGIDFSGNETLQFRIYRNDLLYGTNFYAPETLLYDSGAFGISETPGATLNFLDLSVPVPTNFTWTVQFGGVDANLGESAGLSLFNPPGVGSSSADYWSRSGTNDTWLLFGPSGPYIDVALNFGARAYAAPVSTDVKLPAISVLHPKTNVLVNPVFITGVASDAGKNLALVLIKPDGGTYVPATPTGPATNRYATWTAPVALEIAGTNKVWVKAVDSAGLESVPKSHTFFFAVPSPLLLVTNGIGFGGMTVATAPEVSTNEYFVGRNYSMTALPFPGNLFSNMVAQTNGTDYTIYAAAPEKAAQSGATFTFRMQTNLTLTGTFFENTFATYAGVYEGLYSDPAGMAHQSAGYITFKTDGKLKYSGKVYVEGEKVSFGGTFTLGGVGVPKAGKVVARKGQELTKPLTIIPIIDLTGNKTITGIVSDGTWTSSILADMQVYNLTNAMPLTSIGATQYTMILPGSTIPEAEPGGEGYNLVSIALDSKAKPWVKAAGYYGDGHKVKALKVMPSKDNKWPYYAPLYKYYRTELGVPYTTYLGSIQGWLTFANTNVQDELYWSKLAGWTNGVYNGGFSNSVDWRSIVTGSLYQPPTLLGQHVIAVTNGLVTLAEGALPSSPTNFGFAWTDLNKLVLAKAYTSTNPWGMKLSVSAKNGEVKGSFINPANPATATKIYGAVLQNADVAHGTYFYIGGMTNTGPVQLQQAPP